MNGRVLLADDDAVLRRAIRDRLVHWGLSVTEAADGDAAVAAALEEDYDLILLDLAMPKRSGLQALVAMRQEGVASDVAVLTAHGSVAAAVEALRAGAQDFLQKPAEVEVLRALVERSLERRRGERVRAALAERVGDPGTAVLGESAAIRALLDTAARAARSDATVLITGESGSGKQVLAEYVHAHSARQRGPFVYVNCVALSDDLVETSLFGHEKGAFTGAVTRKPGRVELATGGTAFLDEIGDTTPRFQTKLLHFLETGEFERVGGTRTLRADCRLVAATNRDLREAVRSGRFREDLFYRLDVIHLVVPPLRERREDVPVLARAFAARFARELGRGTVRLDPATVAALEAHPWPGNVRQLRNAVERMVVLAPGEDLTPDLLPPEVGGAGALAPDVADDLPFHDAVQAFRRAYLARALQRAGGSPTRAAARLGLQRTFLHRLLREAGLQAPPPDDGPAADAT